MKLTTKYFTNAVFILLLSLTVLAIGCSNPAGDDDDHEEHLHAEGAVLKMSGAEIVRIEEGEVKSGNIEVNSGEETALITIYFLDENGDEFQPEHDYELRWDQIDTAVAEIEQHEEDGKWSFHVVGVESGETSVRFRMWHTEEGHSDFDTPAIPIIVN